MAARLAPDAWSSLSALLLEIPHISTGSASLFYHLDLPAYLSMLLGLNIHLSMACTLNLWPHVVLSGLILEISVDK